MLNVCGVGHRYTRALASLFCLFRNLPSGGAGAGWMLRTIDGLARTVRVCIGAFIHGNNRDQLGRQAAIRA